MTAERTAAGAVWHSRSNAASPPLDPPAKPKTRAAEATPGSSLPAFVAPQGSARVMGVGLTHAGKALWPDAHDGRPVCKLDLARYYEAVEDWLIPHIEGRPCSMLRMPDGITGDETFFQRHLAAGQSSLIKGIALPGERKPYLAFDRVEALIAAAHVAGLELHPCNGRPSRPERPGRLVFDLDPAPDVAFDAVIAAAHALRDRLEDLGLVGLCKTTGGKGLPIVVPLSDEAIDWPAAKGFAHDVCQRMAAEAPGRTLITMAKKARAGRIFLDYLRNDRLSTAVAPLSPHGRPGAPVSMPLGWSAVKLGLDPAAFTLRTVPALLPDMTAWQDYPAAERPLSRAIARLGKG